MPTHPEIQIDLDPGPWKEAELRDYRLAGDEIGGRIRIKCDEPVSCRGLVAKVGWYTEGKGDRDEEAVFEQTLHTGELRAGEFTFPFSTKLPISPISYSGHYLTIVWRIEASLDLAWKRDPIAEKVFYVMPRTALS
jgi:hypothetical protein